MGTLEYILATSQPIDIRRGWIGCLVGEPIYFAIDLAEIFDRQPATISLWSRQGKLPPAKRMDGRIYWHVAEVQPYIENFVSGKK